MRPFAIALIALAIPSLAAEPSQTPLTKLVPVSLAKPATSPAVFNGRPSDGMIHRAAVVRVHCYEPWKIRDGVRVRAEPQGTGAVIYSDAEHSMVATNAHVIEGTFERIVVETVKGDARATVVYRGNMQAGEDLALLFIRSPAELPALILADPPSPQSPVFSAGFPGSNPLTPRSGVVTPTNFSDGVTIETTFRVQQGESGSPLVDNAGQLVGVINANGSGNENHGNSYAVRSAALVRGVNYCIGRGGILQRIGNRILSRANFRAGIGQPQQCTPAGCPPQQPLTPVPQPPTDLGLSPPNNAVPIPAGPQGEPGKDGRDGIDGQDGQDVTPEQLAAIAAAITQQLKADPSLKGPQGDPGEAGRDGRDGRGVEKITMDDKGNLLVTYDDNSSHTIGNVYDQLPDDLIPDAEGNVAPAYFQIIPKRN